MVHVRGIKETGTGVIFDVTQANRSLNTFSDFYVLYMHSEFFMSIVGCLYTDRGKPV